MPSKIADFYEKMKSNPQFNQKLLLIKEKYADIKDFEEKLKVIIEELIIPFSNEYGYDFNVQELMEFEKTSSENNLETIDNHRLNEISGGTSLLTKSLCLTALLGFSALGNFTANIANAETVDQGTAISRSQSSKLNSEKVDKYVSKRINEVKSNPDLTVEDINTTTLKFQKELDEISQKAREAAADKTNRKDRAANEKRNAARNWFSKNGINWGNNTAHEAKGFLNIDEAKSAFSKIIEKLKEIKVEKQRLIEQNKLEEQRRLENQRKAEAEKRQREINAAYESVDFSKNIDKVELSDGVLTIHVDDVLESASLSNKEIKAILNKFDLGDEIPRSVVFSGNNMWKFLVKRGDYDKTLKVYDEGDKIFTSINVLSNLNKSVQLIIDYEGNVRAIDRERNKLNNVTLDINDVNSIKETYPELKSLVPHENISSLKMQTSTGDIFYKDKNGYVYLHNLNSSGNITLNKQDIELFNLLNAKDEKIWLENRKINVSVPESVNKSIIAKPSIFSFSSTNKNNSSKIRQEIIKERINFAGCFADYSSGCTLGINNSANLNNISRYSQEMEQNYKVGMIKALLSSQDKNVEVIKTILGDRNQHNIDAAIENLAKNSNFRNSESKAPYVTVPVMSVQRNGRQVKSATMNMYIDNFVCTITWDSDKPSEAKLSKPKGCPNINDDRIRNAKKILSRELHTNIEHIIIKLT